MAKPSAFMRQMQANQERNMRLQRLFTIQQCEDMAIITLGQDFGFGPKRGRRVPGQVPGDLRGLRGAVR